MHASDPLFINKSGLVRTLPNQITIVMTNVTTKAVAKVAAVATGLAMAVSMLAFAPYAHAASLTDAQVQSILSLLSSFGADSATIANVQSALTGQPTSGTTTGGGTNACFSGTTNLTLGSTGADVMELQKYLNANGSVVSATGAGSVGNETDYFGSRTKAALAKWQSNNGVSPASGYFGPITRAKIASMCSTTGGTTTGGTTGGNEAMTGTGLKVSLAASSPNGTVLVQGQAIAKLAEFTFANPTSASINVTNLSFNRTGVSNDSTLSNVYLYNGATRLTDSAGISNTAFSFNESAGIFTVPAGATMTISVLSDIATGTSGEQVGASLASVNTSGTLDASVSFPIASGFQTISSATLATVDFNTTTLPSGTTMAAQDDYTVWQNTVTVGTRAVKFSSFQLRNIGSVSQGSIKNFRLYVDGVQVGTAVTQISSGDTVTFDLSSAPVRMETGGRVVKVVADVVNGAGDTFQFSLRRAADARFIDTELNQPILSTANGSGFSARAATSATIDSGTVSVTKASNSPTSNVSVDATNVKWATFEMRAAGEDVKVESLDVNADASTRGLDNGKVFVNGVQVGSTKDLTEDTDVNFTFGSSFILKAGETAIVDIYADAKSTTGASFSSSDTVQITLGAGSSNAQGQSSLTSINVPGSNTLANSVTVTSSSLTLTKFSGYGDQTMIAGTNNGRLGSFTLSTGSTEGASVNTITVALSTEESATITDLRLVDNATGAALGTTRATPSTSNSFSVNFTVPASSTKTIDIYGNIKSGANAGTWIANADAEATGATTGTSISVTANNLQTITIGTATLTATVDPGTPANNNVIAGASEIHVGKFDFATANSSYTVEEVAVKVLANNATSVGSVTLKYKDKDGAAQTVSQALTLSSGAQTHATATFTGLNFYVPLDDSADLDVYVSVPTTQNGASSGRGITVLLDADEGFKAVDSAGTSDTSLASADLDSAANTGYGTQYVKKTIPTLAKVTTGLTGTPTSGSAIYKFTMAADAAGTVEWKKISFTVSTTGVTASSFTLYDVTSGSSVAVNTSAVEATSGGVVAIYAGTSANDTVQQVGAGATKTYELRPATVSGWGSGDQITISFTEDAAAVANSSSATLNGTDDFVWSDRSSTSHTTITADWTNAYLIKDHVNDTHQFVNSN